MQNLRHVNLSEDADTSRFSIDICISSFTFKRPFVSFQSTTTVTKGLDINKNSKTISKL